MGDLQARFESFLMELGAVSLDTREWDAKFAGLNRPDYFLEKNNIVFEIKSITSNPKYKAIEEIDRNRTRLEFPFIFGSANIQDILSRLHDGEEINKRIYGRVTKQIDDYLRHSNKQLRDAKKVFSRYIAGILVVLNDTVDILDPEIVAHRVATRLRNKNQNWPVYPNIDFVLIFDERNVMVRKDGVRTLACISLEGSNVASFVSQNRYIDELQESWASFNQSPLFIKSSSFGDFERG